MADNQPGHTDEALLDAKKPLSRAASDAATAVLDAHDDSAFLQTLLQETNDRLDTIEAEAFSSSEEEEEDVEEEEDDHKSGEHNGTSNTAGTLVNVVHTPTAEEKEAAAALRKKEEEKRRKLKERRESGANLRVSFIDRALSFIVHGVHMKLLLHRHCMLSLFCDDKRSQAMLAEHIPAKYLTELRRLNPSWRPGWYKNTSLPHCTISRDVISSLLGWFRAEMGLNRSLPCFQTLCGARARGGVPPMNCAFRQFRSAWRSKQTGSELLTLLFVCLCRSLGLRTRYVAAFAPYPAVPTRDSWRFAPEEADKAGARSAVDKYARMMFQKGVWALPPVSSAQQRSFSLASSASTTLTSKGSLGSIDLASSETLSLEACPCKANGGHNSRKHETARASSSNAEDDDETIAMLAAKRLDSARTSETDNVKPKASTTTPARNAKRKRSGKHEAIEIDHADVCDNCGDGGDLLCCDGCPSTYHLACLKPALKQAPAGEWYCHKCVPPRQSERSDEVTDSADEKEEKKTAGKRKRRANGETTTKEETAKSRRTSGSDKPNRSAKGKTKASKSKSESTKTKSKKSKSGTTKTDVQQPGETSLCWAEVCLDGRTWMHVDVGTQRIDQPSMYAKTSSFVYVVGFSTDRERTSTSKARMNSTPPRSVVSIVDVTRRYVSDWAATSQQRVESVEVKLPDFTYDGPAVEGRFINVDGSKWWPALVRDQALLANGDVAEALTGARARTEAESRELNDAVDSKPTTLEACRKHPLYCIEKFCKKFEVIYPKGPEHVVGQIRTKSQVHDLYPRTHLHVLHTRDRWRREVPPREVRPGSVPVKSVAKLRISKREEDMQAELFGIWQTRVWLPVAQNGQVPRGERGHVELWSDQHLPKGTAFVDLPRIKQTATQLGIDFAPAMHGFEVKQGRSVPVVRGIVVCEEHKEALLLVHEELEEVREERPRQRHETEMQKKWARLIHTVLTYARVEERHGNAKE